MASSSGPDGGGVPVGHGFVSVGVEAHVVLINGSVFFHLNQSLSKGHSAKLVKSGKKLTQGLIFRGYF